MLGSRGGGWVMLQSGLMAVAAVGWLLPGRPGSRLVQAIGIALALVWWRKSEFEERVLAGRFAGYGEYRARVRRRFLPWIV
jgi:protein-S-isoprenylcysteine O-methyltransferase Ste14